ncbi:DUF397 domain-containing protein [Streptomyces sp. NPDC059944]|uniref:DUF397 domain-containing protein n=1 Tax=unclassified Streptomyces TaxID=2593676 RepID=UPI0036694E50
MTRETSSGDARDLTWFKSSYSDSSNPSDCVEVATAPPGVHVRDSKRPDDGRLALGRATWSAFVTFAAQG